MESKAVDYDTLYASVFDKPATYIRFSQTVEECTGCQYNMTTEDDEFLKAYNQKRPTGPQLSEDDFEKMMEVYEETALFNSPYAAVDNHVVAYEDMEPSLKEAALEEKIYLCTKDVYEYWKARRQECGNRGIQPSLKFETHQENDDGDPYVCFRRREARNTRKTRARDMQSTDKLRRLRRELEEGRNLVKAALIREQMKQDLLATDRAIFDQRAKTKEAKIRLGIKGDDDDLINQKPKRKLGDIYQPMQRPPGAPIRLSRPDGRPIESDLVLLSDILAQKDLILQREIESKILGHQRWNANHEDLTRAPLSPVSQPSGSGFRTATAQYQYLITPPSSVNSESFDNVIPVQEKPDDVRVRYSTPPPEEESNCHPAYRRRIGRGGRLWIDRRGMSIAAKAEPKEDAQPENNIPPEAWRYDQEKYDQDDDDEQPVYEIDPYDTNALKFRASIPYPPHLLPNPQRRPDDRAIQAVRVSPINNRNNPPLQPPPLPQIHPPT